MSEWTRYTDDYFKGHEAHGEGVGADECPEGVNQEQWLDGWTDAQSEDIDYYNQGGRP